jgi:hypothetical protein
MLAPVLLLLVALGYAAPASGWSDASCSSGSLKHGDRSISLLASAVCPAPQLFTCALLVDGGARPVKAGAPQPRFLELAALSLRI